MCACVQTLTQQNYHFDNGNFALVSFLDFQSKNEADFLCVKNIHSIAIKYFLSAFLLEEIQNHYQ